MVSKFFILIGRLLNWAPLLHVSSDSDFGSFDGSKSDARLSLLSLSLGQHKYYLLSIIKSDAGWRVELFKDLDFYDICEKSSQESIDKKVGVYESKIKDNNDVKLTCQIELLKEKITQNRSRISNSYTKLNSYRSLVLALSAVGVFLLAEIINVRQFGFLAISSVGFLLLFTLYGLSSFLQITFALKVKSFVRSSFKKLKQDTTKVQLAKSFYTDFISLNNESQITVSITKNVEKYFNRCFLMLIVAWLCVFVSQNDLLHIELKNAKSYESEYVVVNSEKKLQPEQLSAFFNTLNSHKGAIYIVSNKSTSDVAQLVEFLDVYLLENQKLKTIILRTESLKDNVVLLKYGN